MSGRTVLVADDDAAIRTVLVQALGRAGYEVRAAANASTLWGWVSDGQGDLVLTDVVMPDESGLDLIPRIRKIRPELKIIVMSAQSTLLTAVKATERGAFEYLPKPFDLNELLRIIERALESSGSPAGDEAAASDAEDAENLPLIGRSQAMQEIYRTLARLMGTDLSVLITGESGTGKELVARALHDYGKYRNNPFVAINMAAIPRDLIESELFGHEKGAFTGASQRHLGYAERAGDGILFLDEIGELRAELQAKLLRLIEDKSFYRVGGERPIPFKGRILIATNADLAKLVEAGKFREDLYYRINVVSVKIPPLRERPNDISWLMEKFFIDSSTRIDTSLKGISALAEEAALGYSWPGNVRELRNRMERAVALGLGQWVMPGDLFPEQSDRNSSSLAVGSLEDARQHAEKRHIARALAATNGEIGAASRLLGIGRTTLWDKMRRLGLNTED